MDICNYIHGSITFSSIAVHHPALIGIMKTLWKKEPPAST